MPINSSSSGLMVVGSSLESSLPQPQQSAKLWLRVVVTTTRNINGLAANNHNNHFATTDARKTLQPRRGQAHRTRIPSPTARRLGKAHAPAATTSRNPPAQ